MSVADTTKSSPIFTWFIQSLILILLAAWGRSFFLSDDFWFDEIWSLEFARGSALDVFFRFHHDNNHKLNTLCLWFLGERDDWQAYRYPSFIAGLLTIPLVVAIALRHGDAGYAGTLYTFSFVMGVYSTEARGYAMLVLFSLLAFAFLREYLSGRRWLWLPLFWLTAILGFLAHLTFVHAYFAFVVWSMRRFSSEKRGSSFEIAQLLRCHAIPALFFCLLYWVDIRKMERGGSDVNYANAVEILADIFGTTVGAPQIWWLALPAFVVIARLLFWELRSEWRYGSDEWVFYVAVILASPLLFVIVLNPGALFVRYFLVSIAFFLLLLGRSLQRLHDGGRWSKEFATLMVVAMVGGNLLFGLGFFTGGGRGQYSFDLQRIAGERNVNEPLNDITVSSDHDFRNGKLVEFYTKRLAIPFVKYVPNDSLPRRGTDWRIIHSLDPLFDPPAEIKDSLGNRYELATRGRGLRRAGISGWAWFLYRRDMLEKVRQEKQDRGEPF